jgi:preprotein translocase subunit SecF
MLKYRYIFLFVSGILALAGVVSLFMFGLNLGIDFTGGSLIELRISETVFAGKSNQAQIIQTTMEGFTDFNLGAVRVQPTAGGSYIIRLRTLTEEEHQVVLSELEKTLLPKTAENTDEKKISPSAPVVSELKFESIGPIIGKELKEKAIWQLLIVVVGIILYIAYVFRKLGKLKKNDAISWKFGTIAIIALFHDVLITVGIFSVLGRFAHIEIDNSFIAAILTVLGYSVNDTIVIFDRIRENMIRNSYSLDIKSIVNNSLSETMTRSLNTMSTTLIVLFAILLFGGSSTFNFVLALIIGIAFGTYSSIFVAGPLLYEWEKGNSERVNKLLTNKL